MVCDSLHFFIFFISIDCPVHLIVLLMAKLRVVAAPAKALGITVIVIARVPVVVRLKVAHIVTQ